MYIYPKPSDFRNLAGHLLFYGERAVSKNRLLAVYINGENLQCYCGSKSMLNEIGNSKLEIRFLAKIHAIVSKT